MSSHLAPVASSTPPRILTFGFPRFFTYPLANCGLTTYAISHLVNSFSLLQQPLLRSTGHYIMSNHRTASIALFTASFPIYDNEGIKVIMLKSTLISSSFFIFILSSSLSYLIMMAPFPHYFTSFSLISHYVHFFNIKQIRPLFMLISKSLSSASIFLIPYLFLPYLAVLLLMRSLKLLEVFLKIIWFNSTFVADFSSIIFTFEFRYNDLFFQLLIIFLFNSWKSLSPITFTIIMFPFLINSCYLWPCLSLY